MLERIGYAVGGALMGGIATCWHMHYSDVSMDWRLVEKVALICGVISFIVGKEIVLILAALAQGR